jgi:hypothetical protein
MKSLANNYSIESVAVCLLARTTLKSQFAFLQEHYKGTLSRPLVRYSLTVMVRDVTALLLVVKLILS